MRGSWAAGRGDGLHGGDAIMDGVMEAHTMDWDKPKNIRIQVTCMHYFRLEGCVCTCNH